jgi:hypothetical protein
LGKSRRESKHLLIIYKLQIDTGKEGLPPDLSVGFQDAVYHLSTAPLEDFHDCLDGNSFSDISQENMILKGGELSLAGNVKIKIVSTNIIRHILLNEIELLGCRVSMFAIIDEVEKIIFEGMLISEYSQTDEVSFEMTLEDSTFANVGQLNLKVPQGFGGGAQLETSYGSECLLKLYKQDKQEMEDKTISQGIKRSDGFGLGYGVLLQSGESPTPELEQGKQSVNQEGILTDYPLVTSDEKPSFAKNFVVYETRYLGAGRPAEILVQSRNFNGSWIFGSIEYFAYDLRRIPEIPSRLKGKYIEICSGRGKGNLYKITEVKTVTETMGIYAESYTVIVLDRSVKIGDILGKTDVKYQNLKRLPIAENNYKHLLGGTANANLSEPAITQNFKKNSTDENEIEDISVFRFAESSDRYAVPKMKNVSLSYIRDFFTRGNAKVINDDGSLSDASIEANIVEENNDYSILEFPSGSSGKTVISETGKHQPCWVVGDMGVSLWSNQAENGQLNMFVTNGREVAEDSKNRENYQTVIECPFVRNRKQGLQATLYWRIDDLPFNGKYKIKPRFSFWVKKYEYYFSARSLLIDDAGNAIDVKNYNIDGNEDRIKYSFDAKISLTRERVDPNIDKNNIGVDYERLIGKEREDAENLLANLQNLLVFESETKAKYIYLQLFFNFDQTISSGVQLAFSALPVVCEREVDIDKMFIKGSDSRDHSVEREVLGSGTRVIWYDERYDNIAKRTKCLCQDYGINIDSQSFTEAGEEINEIFGKTEYEFPFIPLKHGDNFQDKLEEICRAVNFSMFSDGSKLYAKYFHATDSDPWIVYPSNVIKGSLEVRSVNSVATEWNFSANTWDGQKTLSMNVDPSASFPDSEWTSVGTSFDATMIYREYMQGGILGFGARVECTLSNTYADNVIATNNFGKFNVGDMYLIKSKEPGFEAGTLCKLVSLRITATGEDALFVVPHETLQLSTLFPDSSNELEITPLSQERNWRTIVCGNLDIGIDSAKRLWETSQIAFAKIKKKAKLDERYSKHQVAAFADDSSWVKNFLKTAKHNSFAKTIISFKIPINHLPEGSLPSLLLKRTRLAFGRFRHNNLDGWVSGYSLVPAEDAVRIEFINSEPAKDILWLDENKLKDQLIVDEREPAQKFYSEE